MYILECSDGSYYTGSTKDLELRLQQHQNGEGANHTKKRLPVKLVYFEEFQRIDEAFYREKQVQGWSRKKKEALIKGDFDKLIPLSKNYTQFYGNVVSTSSTTGASQPEPLPENVVSTSSTTLLPLPEPLPEPVEGNTTKHQTK
jgi:putative endonuclease